MAGVPPGGVAARIRRGYGTARRMCENRSTIRSFILNRLIRSSAKGWNSTAFKAGTSMPLGRQRTLHTMQQGLQT